MSAAWVDEVMDFAGPLAQRRKALSRGRAWAAMISTIAAMKPMSLATAFTTDLDDHGVRVWGRIARLSGCLGRGNIAWVHNQLATNRDKFLFRLARAVDRKQHPEHRTRGWNKRAVPRAVVTLRIEPDDLAVIDDARGETPRNVWIVEAAVARAKP